MSRIENNWSENIGSHLTIVGASGKFAKHLWPSLRAAADEQGVPIFAIDIKKSWVVEQEGVIPPDVGYLNVKRAGDLKEIQRLVQRTPGTIYVATPPSRHLQDLWLYADRSVPRRAIVQKPLASTTAEIFRYERRVRDATERVFMDDHYTHKRDFWLVEQVLRREPEAIRDIEGIDFVLHEPQTIEEEGRMVAVGDGVFPDLGIHALSMMDRVLSAYAEKKGGLSRNVYTVHVTKAAFGRYDGCRLEEEKETYAYFEAWAEIMGQKRQSIKVRCSVGKGVGAQPEKYMGIHRGHKNESINADFVNNSVTGLPDSVNYLVQHLQLNPQWHDTRGTGHAVQEGVAGRRTNEHFLSFHEATALAQLMEDIVEKSRKTSLYSYAVGKDSREILPPYLKAFQ